MSLLVLSAADVREVVSSFSTTFLQELMRQVFITVSRTASSTTGGIPDIQTPHRTAIEMASHTTLFMPARVFSDKPRLEGTSIKVVSVPRQEGDIRGLPATTLVLNEETGAVDAVINARELTALRNAAGSLLSTTLVGIHKPQRIVLFGAGKQIEAHLSVFLKHYPSIKFCTLVNRNLNERALDLFKTAIATFPRVTFHLFPGQDRDSIQNSVSSADIIVCATSAASPLFPSSWVPSGTHVVLVGSYKPHMQEVEEALVQRAIPTIRPTASQRISQALIVDSREACIKEAGDLIKAGVGEESMLEIGELLQDEGQSLTELAPGSHSNPGNHLTQTTEVCDFEGPITMFKSVGIGLQDVVMAKEVVSHAKTHRHVGTLVGRYDAPF
ncbi:NAD(P)-binding protein [Macrolepiota fuliginosa MF-IS2]|uniref:NAD(P)-binding protein n=1 Tax=Macrolepiota fuliginosa MF-IS2 TaxID=1400762 RepID=A0A9P5XFE9_9AGAR|nr:NAD(P)-binding protein [Macrolepiota fuliginosa MF-IS2]